MFWHILGSAAAILTMFAFVPQIIKTFEKKSARDLSLIMLVQLSLGVSLWVIYGVYLGNFIIIAANGVTLACLVILAFLYWKYRNRGDR